MPKRKAPEPLTPVLATTTRSRRQASKEALKQMQILLDDEDEESETLEIPSDDDDDVPIIRLSDRRSGGVSSSQQKERLSSPVQVKSETHPPPKKKYKLSHRKSSDGNDRDVLVLKSISNHVNTENTLELDCWVEELSEVQKELKKKYDDECKVLEKKIEELVKSSNVSTVHKTDLSSAYEITEPPPPPPPLATSNIILQPQNNSSTQSYQLVMDPRLGLIVAGTLPTSVVTTSSTQPPPLTTPSKQQQSTFKGKVQISQAVKAVANATAESDDTPSVRQTRTRTRANRISPVPSPVSSPVTRGSAQSVLKNVAQVTKTPVTKITAPVTKTPVAKVTTPVAKTPVSKISIPKQTTSAPVTRLRSGPNSTPPTTQIAQSSSRPAEANVEGGLVAGTSKRSSMQDLAEETRGQADSREIAFNKLQGKTYPSLVVVARPHMRVKDLNTDRSKLDTKVKSVLMHPPTKFTEWLIQQGLVRSEQKCSIHTTSQLKLGMYSDVSKFPYSGGYVWISECCPQRFVSVFSGSLFEGSPHPPVVILKLLYHWSCQTNIQNVVQWVKVDNLYVKGLYTWLRSVCTVAIHTHIKQLGGPGAKVEVGVISLGTTSQDGNQRQVKVEVLGILETTTKFIRLRAVEPDTDKNYKKRFSKILEPVMHWVHPSSTIITDLTVDKSTLVSMGFSNVVQSTSVEYGNSNRMIMEYLRQVVPRMFQNTLSLLSRQIIQQFLDELVWREWFGTTSAQAFDNIVIHLAEQTRADLGSSLIARLNRVAANPFKGWALSNTSNYTVTKAGPTNNTSAAPTTESTAKRYTRVRKPLPPQSPSSHEDSPPPRPVRSVSPDVPEQMVPLENYYYGTIEPPRHIQEKVSLNMKCPFCKLSLNNNIGLMHHLFKHAHNVSGETRLCRYCLTGVPNNTDLMNHIATSHPSETKFDNGFVCLICETQFMNPFVLGKHMSREHCPYELPYQCGSCSYRCSNHKQAIDHFYQCHSNGPAIQCPFCLKSTLLMSGGRYIPQNMNYFIQHLQKHQKKQIAKRCGKCNLWFIQKDLLKEHQTKMHVSQRGKPRLIPWTAPRNCVMVPKSKIDEVPDDELINYSSLHFSVTKNLVCKECDMCLDSPKHLSSFESCSNTNCQYSTCCANAMKKHNDNCKVLNETLPKEPLPYIMFCICGFSSNDGNVLARHLAICEKKSAYPSRAAANKAVVNQSMLDVLGLVRKPEESQITEDKTEKSKPEAVKKDDDYEAEDNEKLSKTVIEMAKKSKSDKEVAIIELDDDDENIESATDKAEKKSLGEKQDSVEILSDDNKRTVNKKRKSGKHNKQNDEKQDKEPDIEMKDVNKTDDSKENSKSKKDGSEKEPNTQKSDESNIVNNTEKIEETATEITKENSSNVEDKSVEKEVADQETSSSVQHEEHDVDMSEESPVIPGEEKAIKEPSEDINFVTNEGVASSNQINEEEACSNQINEDDISSDQTHEEEAPNQIDEEEASSNQNNKEDASSNQINGEEASSDQINEEDTSSNQINEEATSSNQINEDKTSNKLEEEEASSDEINEEEASSSQINEGTSSGEINEEEVPSGEINEENTLLEETADQINEKDTASCKMNESFMPTENGTENSMEEMYEAPERNNEDNADSVVAQSVLDTLAAECANTAKSSMFNNEEVERMDVDSYNDSTDYNLVESETPMDIN